MPHRPLETMAQKILCKVDEGFTVAFFVEAPFHAIILEGHFKSAGEMSHSSALNLFITLVELSSAREGEKRTFFTLIVKLLTSLVREAII